jgi:hypothetical protein
VWSQVEGLEFVAGACPARRQAGGHGMSLPGVQKSWMLAQTTRVFVHAVLSAQRLICATVASGSLK